MSSPSWTLLPSVTPRDHGIRRKEIAQRAESYAISADTVGKLRWSGGDLDGDHLICGNFKRDTGVASFDARIDAISKIQSDFYFIRESAGETPFSFSKARHLLC
ncbi:MAG: hypothetical protein LAP39_20850 [Acidobacteriia bacterium]|nr:hypothetical protein [Terriglobia bacterium]